MNEIVVEVKNLTKKFGDFIAVDNISFKIKKGEIIGLLGPNGAGKTTTIRMLLNLISPTSGKIIIFDSDLSLHREKILQRINFSSSYTSMDWRLSVMENLIVFAKLYNIPFPKEKIEQLLRRFEIWDLRNQRIASLSSGEATRLNLCKALINDPEILFLDEPTVSLDPYIADKTRRILKEIKKERNLTILYTSHNMPEIEIMCNYLIFLHRGQIIANGNPIEVTKKILTEEKEKPDLEEVFIRIAENKI
ncbi:ABC transporter ATP-binding protein [Candidatus Gottesmanbacteria bacterium]|nr:ABC transporter ATP-binding protein [Candidatus Gottesmanbacteria bacterium]